MSAKKAIGLGCVLLFLLVILYAVQYLPYTTWSLHEKGFDSSKERGPIEFVRQATGKSETANLDIDFNFTINASGGNGLLFTTSATPGGIRLLLNQQQQLSMVIGCEERTYISIVVGQISVGKAYRARINFHDKTIKMWLNGVAVTSGLIPDVYNYNIRYSPLVDDVALGIGDFRGQITGFNLVAQNSRKVFTDRVFIMLQEALMLALFGLLLLGIAGYNYGRIQIYECRGMAFRESNLVAAETLAVMLVLSLLGWLVFCNVGNPMLGVPQDFVGYGELMPERPERMTYVVVCLAAPFCFLAAMLILRGRALHARWWCWMPVVLPVLALIAWRCNNQMIDFNLCPAITLNWAVFILTVTGAVVLFFLLLKYYRYEKFGKNLWLILLLAVPLLQVLATRLYWPASLPRHEWYDLGIIIYSVTQAAIGNPEIHQYGFYPVFIAPLFGLTGISVLKITAVLAGVFVLSFIMIGLAVRPFIRIPLLLFGWLVTMVFITWSGYDIYFSYFPIRLFGPALMLWLFSRVLRSDFGTGWLVTAGLAGGVVLFWNFESGMPAIAAVFFVLLCSWYHAGLRCGGVRLLKFGAAFLAAVVLAYLFISWRFGYLVDPGKYFLFHSLFMQVGFGLLPLPPPPAPWMALGIVYLSGLGWGLHRQLRGRADDFSRMMLFLAIIGMGLFSWYQGRSYPLSFPNVAWPGVIMLFMFSDRIIRAVRCRRLPRLHALAGFPAVWIMMAVLFTLTCRSGEIGQALSSSWRDMRQMGEASPVSQNVEFIRHYAGGRKVVNIIGDGQGVYYAETGLRAGISQFNEIEILLRRDWERVRQALAQSEYPLFVATNFSGKKLTFFANDKWPEYRLIAVSPDGRIKYYEPLKR